jgi:hypothetical protein
MPGADGQGGRDSPEAVEHGRAERVEPALALGRRADRERSRMTDVRQVRVLVIDA